MWCRSNLVVFLFFISISVELKNRTNLGLVILSFPYFLFFSLHPSHILFNLEFIRTCLLSFLYCIGLEIYNYKSSYLSKDFHRNWVFALLDTVSVTTCFSMTHCVMRGVAIWFTHLSILIRDSLSFHRAHLPPITRVTTLRFYTQHLQFRKTLLTYTIIHQIVTLN